MTGFFGLVLVLVSSLCAEQAASSASMVSSAAVASEQTAAACAWLRRWQVGTSRHVCSVSAPHAPKRRPPAADHQASMYASAAADTASPEMRLETITMMKIER